MALITLDSFDNPAYSVPADLVTGGKWVYQAGIELNASYAHYGSNGIRFTYGDSLRTVNFAVGSVNPIIVGFWLYIDAHTTASDVDFLFFYTYASQNYANFTIQVGKNASSEIVFHYSFASGGQDSTIPLSTDTWMYITFEVYCKNAPDGYLKLYINGTLVETITGKDSQGNGDATLNGLAFLSTFNSGLTYWLDSVHIIKPSGDTPTTVQDPCDVGWVSGEDVLIPAWAEPEIDDNLNTWADAVSVVLGVNLQIGDDLASWLDEIEIYFDLLLNVSVADNLNSWYDYELETHLDVYLDPITREVADDLNEFGDSLDAISYFFEGADALFECGDDLFFNDEIKLNFEYHLDLTEDLNAWDDEVEVIMGIFTEVAQDEMTSTWADAIETDLCQLRSASDSMSMSDAVSVSLLNPLIEHTVTDSLNSWNDTIQLRATVRRNLADSFTLYDRIQLFMTMALRIADSLSLSDSVEVELIDIDYAVSATESLNLWADLITLDLPLTVQVGDSMSMSDALSSEAGDGDMDYIRRYLNDVIR